MRFCVALCSVMLTLLMPVTRGLAQAADDSAAASAQAAGGSADAKDKEASEQSGPDDEAAAGKPGSAEAEPQAPPAASAASSSARPSSKAPPESAVDGSTFTVRLRDLEQRIDELKEQIRRSHTRLSLLSDTILSGGVGGSRAHIALVNDMSEAFRLTKILVVLDGAVLYNKTDETGGLSEQERIPVFNGSMPPGDHTVQVKVELRGHGYGVFSYLRGYNFKVEDSHSFTITEGKTIELRVIAYEKGGITTPLEQRPNIRFVEKLTTSARAAQRKGKPKVKASGGASLQVGTP